MYSQLGATSLTMFPSSVWIAFLGIGLLRMKSAIWDQHLHMKEKASKPCQATGQITQIKTISNKLQQSLPMSIQGCVKCQGDCLSVDIIGFNAAAKQIFRMDSPHGIPLSFILQGSGDRLVNSLTRALNKNAASQRPVGGMSFASANLHALKFRSIRGCFAASATLVCVLDHATGQRLLCIEADIPEAWRSKEVECNHNGACAKTQVCKGSFCSEPEAMKRYTAPKVTWSRCLVETIVFQA